MKKIITFILFIFSLSAALGQSVAQRSTPTITAADARWMANRNMFIPRYTDSVAANLDLGVDTCGAMFYAYSTQSIWYRQCSPKKWVQISGGGGSGFTAANNGLTAPSTTVQLGGSDLSQYTAVGLNGFPLSIVHNGVNSAAQADSNSLKLINNTAAATITDSLVSPMLQFWANSRKTLGGAASQRISIQMDLLGTAGSTSPTGLFRWFAVRNTTRSQIFSMTTSGVIPDPLSLNGLKIGSTGATTLWFGINTLAGANNTAIGASSMQANVSGTDNTALGQLSLAVNLTGNYNTAIGAQALNNNDVDLNTAVGYAAMEFNTSGVQNAAFGANALTTNTSGQKNSAIGTAALEENTTGSFGTFVGHDAGLHNSTGHQNVGIGWLGNAQNRTGSDNTGVGTSSMRTIILANNSVFVGSESGYLDLAGVATQEDTVSNAIAIGYRSYTTASNQMRLGNPALSSTFIYGARPGSTSDSVYVKKSDGSFGTLAQSSIVGAVPTLQQVFGAQSNTAIMTGDNTMTLGANNSFFIERSGSGSFSVLDGAVSRLGVGAVATQMVAPTGNKKYSVTDAAHSILSLGAGSANSSNRLVGISSADESLGYLSNGLGISITSGVLLADTTVLVNKANAQVIAGIKNFTNGLNVNTSITTASTTLAVFNTTATTVNAFGAATTLNIGASAAMVMTLGGSTTAAKLRVMEPSASGTNYWEITAGAMAANNSYIWPNAFGAAGSVLTDAAGNGTLSWAAASGGGWRTTAGSTTLTGNVTIDASGNDLILQRSAANMIKWLNGEIRIGDAENNGDGLKFSIADGTSIAYVDNSAHTALVGINTSTPTFNLEVAGTAYVSARMTSGSLTTGTDGSTTQDQEIFTIGNTFIGDVANNIFIKVSGSNEASRTEVHGTTVQFPDFGAGVLSLDGSSNLVSTSDARLKHDITPFKYGLKELLTVTPSNYIRNSDASNFVETGFIAQNIKEAFGGYGIGYDKKGMMSLNTNVILGASVNAIQELYKIIQQQQTEIEYLKSRIK